MFKKFLRYIIYFQSQNYREREGEEERVKREKERGEGSGRMAEKERETFHQMVQLWENPEGHFWIDWKPGASSGCLKQVAVVQTLQPPLPSSEACSSKLNGKQCSADIIQHPYGAAALQVAALQQCQPLKFF